jgi:tetratricopeptide (TPR) repeat protein
MSQKDKTVRVFISSTFRDMNVERDHLVTVVFPELRERLEDIGLEFYDVDLRWGVPKLNVDHEQANSWAYCKRWIRRVRPFFLCLIGQRYGWVPPAEQILNLKDRPYAGMSITEMEIRYAVMSGMLRRRAFFYLRKNLVPKDTPPEIYQKYVDSREQRRLRALKKELLRLDRPVRAYECLWDGTGFTGMEEFGRQVLEDLWSGVLRDPRYVPKKFWRGVLGRRPGDDPLYSNESKALPEALSRRVADAARPRAAHPMDVEAAQMDAFSESRLRWFRGREKDVRRLEQFVRRKLPERASHLCVVSAAPGEGKTSLLAKFAERLSTSSAVLVAHFVGATERSADMRSLLERLMYELDRSGIKWPVEDEKGTDLASLKRRLPARLSEYDGRRRVVLLIDALNQLNDGHDLDWLPHSVGPNVRVIVSCVNDASAPADSREAVVWSALKARRPAPFWLEVASLETDNVRRIVADYLREYCKELDVEQIEAICAMSQAANPLYLLAMLNELRTLGGEDMNLKVPGLIARMPEQYPDPVSLFDWILERLEAFGAEHAMLWFGYLASGRTGMTSRELAELLARRLGEDAGRVAPLIERGIRRYLLRRGPYLDFFHGQMREAVGRRYLARDATRYHAEIAEYMQARWPENDAHALSDLPYHLTEARLWDKLSRTLEDQSFLAAKLNAIGPESLAEDFGRGFEVLTEAGEGYAPRLVQSFLRFMVTNWVSADGTIALDAFNPLLLYRQDKTFYTQLLEAGCSEALLREFLPEADGATKIAHVFTGRLAGLKRRQGDLGKAGEIIRALLRTGGRGLNPAERGKLEYELAYVYFLTGRLAKAAELFRRSAVTSLQGGRLVGKWIGRCLEARANYLRGVWPPSQFRRVLEEAREHFRKAESAPGGNANATRWLLNVALHLFEVAFAEQDRESARACFQEVQEDPWVRRFKRSNFLLPTRARMAMLEGEWEAATSHFKNYLDETVANTGSKSEALSREYYDLGRALANSGQQREALAAWRSGLQLSDELGNKFWKKKIREELRKQKSGARVSP